jgi:hypothetical protein
MMTSPKQMEVPMKILTTLALLSISSAAFAADRLSPSNRAVPIRVESVKAAEIDDHNSPATAVTVQATFGNDCMIPAPDDLVVVLDQAQAEDTLQLTVATLQSDKICTMQYLPVTVTIDLGTYPQRAMGLTQHVVVNGVEPLPD